MIKNNRKLFDLLFEQVPTTYLQVSNINQMQFVYECQINVEFVEPGLDVNAGIGNGTSALVVAAMVGNDWAIARFMCFSKACL